MNSEHCRIYSHPFPGYQHSCGRRFLTKEEKDELKKQHQEKKIQWIERYKESLEKELKGINERLDELKNETA